MKPDSLSKKFKNTWVLAEVKETDEFGTPTDVKPLADNKSREKLAEQVKKIQPKHFTFIYTGERKQPTRI